MQIRRAGAVLTLALFACRTRDLPPLPQVSTGNFLPAIRQEIDAAAAAARARPDDAAAAGHFGMVLHAHQQLAAARACYQRAALLEPSRFEWVYYEGIVSEGAGGVEAFRKALSIHDYLPARVKLGEALLAAGDSTGAARALRGIEHPAAWF